MESEKLLAELKDIMVERLKFDPARAAELTPATTLPKGMDGSLGLDSLDFIEMSVAIEERFGLVMDESEDLAPHFQTLGSLIAYLQTRLISR
jgi:acyl carrier protein